MLAMKPLLKNKIDHLKYLNITAILIVVICLAACGRSYEPSRIIPRDSKIAWTKYEVMDLYWMYSDELDEVAEIVLTSDAFRQNATAGYDYKSIINSDEEQFFSKEEWEKIIDLFEKIRTSQIVRSWQEGEDIVRLNFNPLYRDRNWFITTLYYFKTPEIAEKYKSANSLDGLEHLNGYWYIYEQFRKG